MFICKGTSAASDVLPRVVTAEMTTSDRASPQGWPPVPGVAGLARLKGGFGCNTTRNESRRRLETKIGGKAMCVSHDV